MNNFVEMNNKELVEINGGSVIDSLGEKLYTLGKDIEEFCRFTNFKLKNLGEKIKNLGLVLMYPISAVVQNKLCK